MNRSNCPHCGLETLNYSKCQHCSKVLPLDSASDFFSLLNLSKSFAIDLQELKANALEKIAIYHPDNFFYNDTLSINIATESTALVNRALSTLSHHTSRAEYLLSLSNVNINNYSASSLPQNLLLYFMEFQEESDSSKTLEEMQVMKVKAQAALDANYNDLVDSFKNKSHSHNSTILLCVKRKFLDRLMHNIERRLEYLYENV